MWLNVALDGAPSRFLYVRGGDAPKVGHVVVIVDKRRGTAPITATVLGVVTHTGGGDIYRAASL